MLIQADTSTTTTNPLILPWIRVVTMATARRNEVLRVVMLSVTFLLVTIVTSTDKIGEPMVATFGYRDDVVDGEHVKVHLLFAVKTSTVLSAVKSATGFFLCKTLPREGVAFFTCFAHNVSSSHCVNCFVTPPIVIQIGEKLPINFPYPRRRNERLG